MHSFYNCTSPYANEVLWRLAFFPMQGASLYASERRVAGQLMQLDRSQAYANKGVIQLELDKSCHLSGSVLEQSHDYYVICLPMWHVGTWNEITWRNY